MTYKSSIKPNLQRKLNFTMKKWYKIEAFATFKKVTMVVDKKQLQKRKIALLSPLIFDWQVSQQLL